MAKDWNLSSFGKGTVARYISQVIEIPESTIIQRWKATQLTISKIDEHNRKKYAQLC